MCMAVFGCVCKLVQGILSCPDAVNTTEIIAQMMYLSTMNNLSELSTNSNINLSATVLYTNSKGFTGKSGKSKKIPGGKELEAEFDSR